MVELKLESIEEQNMPRDCFISVRVGDVQKLSRLAATRVYRFPQAGERRYGKIEVFRRIGACNVDIDPSNGNVREINVDCKESGFGSLGLHIAVEGDEVAKNKLEDVPAQVKKAGTKVKAAKDYLNKHGLEVRLSEAMQAVLRDRPENPTEYLAMKLLGENGKLPSRTEPTAALSPAKAAPPVPLLPFGNAYYKKNFASMNKSAFASLHSVFPQAPRREEPDRSVKASNRSSSTWMLQPSVGTWCKPLRSGASKKAASMPAGAITTTTKILPFKAFYKANFKQTPQKGFESMYEMFPKSQRQATQAGMKSDNVRETVVNCLLVAADNGDLKKAMMDTIGDSLQNEVNVRLLCAGADGSLERAVRNISAASCKADWCLKPSIGTWCTPLFAKPKVALKASSKADWFLKPSIGTWYMPLSGNPKASSQKEIVGQTMSSIDLIQKYMQAPSPFLRVQSLAHAAIFAANTKPLIAAALAKAAVDVAISMVTSSPAMHPSVATGLAITAISSAEAQSATAGGLIIAAANAALKVAEAGPMCEYYHKPSVASWLRLQQCKTETTGIARAPPPSPILPFGSFYQRHFPGTVESFARSLFDSRPNGAQ